MKQTDGVASLDPDAMSELQTALTKLAKGIPFTDEEKLASCERMDRMRKDNRSRFGETDLAVRLIRDTRDAT